MWYGRRIPGFLGVFDRDGTLARSSQVEVRSSFLPQPVDRRLPDFGKKLGIHSGAILTHPRERR